MKSKKERLAAILHIVRNYAVNNQEDLLQMLKEQGFDVTQATLSRDIKALQIVKLPDTGGKYRYTISKTIQPIHETVQSFASETLAFNGFLSLEFSGQLAIIKTRPGYAMGIASDIDNRLSHAILGTIAGDDTILLIPRETYSKEEIKDALSVWIPKSLLIN